MGGPACGFLFKSCGKLGLLVRSIADLKERSGLAQARCDGQFCLMADPMADSLIADGTCGVEGCLLNRVAAQGSGIVSMPPLL